MFQRAPAKRGDKARELGAECALPQVSDFSALLQRADLQMTLGQIC